MNPKTAIHQWVARCTGPSRLSSSANGDVDDNKGEESDEGESPHLQECRESWQKVAKFPPIEPFVYYKEWTSSSGMPQLECSALYQAMKDPLGKENILKWELLYRVGGIFVDSDVFCVHPLPASVLGPATPCFACFEDEINAPGCINANVVKFPAFHPILRHMIDTMLMYNVSEINRFPAQHMVGSGLLTRSVNHFVSVVRRQQSKELAHVPPITLFPSYWFNPFRATAKQVYNGHGQVFAVRVHDDDDDNVTEADAAEAEEEELLQLMRSVANESKTVEELVSNFVHRQHVFEDATCPWCMVVINGGIDPHEEIVRRWLRLITDQHGGLTFGIEVVWVDSAYTSKENQRKLDALFSEFSATSRNTVVRLYRTPLFEAAQIIEKVAVLFPDRDVVLQFDVHQHLQVLEDRAFLATAINDATEEEAEEEEDEGTKQES